MEHDDNIRAKVGVVVCLRDLGDGKSRIIFDDVVSGTENNPKTWKFDCFYTWNKYSNRDLDNMSLSDKDYQIIGENLVARLLALNKRVE